MEKNKMPVGEMDNVSPKEKWEFDTNVAKCFPDMLERSIPDYRSMRSLVYEIGEKFIKDGTGIMDVGCSTGLAVEPFYRKHSDNNTYFLCDNSEPMLEVAKREFAVGIRDGFVEVVNGNFYEIGIPKDNSLVLSILSLQFMPTAYRQKIINDIYDSLLHGGGVHISGKGGRGRWYGRYGGRSVLRDEAPKRVFRSKNTAEAQEPRKCAVAVKGRVECRYAERSRIQQGRYVLEVPQFLWMGCYQVR